MPGISMELRVIRIVEEIVQIISQRCMRNAGEMQLDSRCTHMCAFIWNREAFDRRTGNARLENVKELRGDVCSLETTEQPHVREQ